MSADTPITMRQCGTCGGLAFLVVEIEGQFYLRCAKCHGHQSKYPLDPPRGALFNIEDARCMAAFIPGADTASILLKAYHQCAAELSRHFQKYPEVLT